jgi:Fic family protein
MVVAGYVDRVWEGDPTARTRAERRSCTYRAYVPDPLLGRPLTLSAATAADITDVERDMLGLQAAHPSMVSLESLARLLLRAEAVASSFIEGLQVNARRLAKEELAVRAGFGSHDDTARAVLANVAAMEAAVRLADVGSSFDVGDVLALHAELMDGTRGAHWGGVLRAEQNWIGGTGLTPCTAEFVPPPPEEVEALLADLCAYASGDEHPALVQAALVHAQFETIHPFLDGNGRTGRALIHVVLRRRGLASTFLPPISLVLATHADRYVTGLMRSRYDAPVDSAEALRATRDWLEFFVADTARACADATRFATTLEELEHRWRERVGKVRRGSATDLLLSSLAAAPVLTVQTAARLVGRSARNVNTAVNALAEAGVLRQTTVGRRNRAFEVPELLEAVTDYERALASPTGDTQQAAPVRPVPARPRR